MFVQTHISKNSELSVGGMNPLNLFWVACIYALPNL